MPLDGGTIVITSEHIRFVDEVIKTIATPDKWCQDMICDRDMTKHCLQGAIMKAQSPQATRVGQYRWPVFGVPKDVLERVGTLAWDRLVKEDPSRKVLETLPSMKDYSMKYAIPSAEYNNTHAHADVLDLLADVRQSFVEEALTVR